MEIEQGLTCNRSRCLVCCGPNAGNIFIEMKSYQFDPDMAERYGVDNAIMIWNLSYWIQHNEANGMHFHDGRTWTFNSVDAFTKIFPFWSKGQIRRILKSLEESGVIMTGNYNQSAYDRKTWYAFTDSFLQMHLSKSTNGNDENDKSNKDSIINQDSTKIINEDNKPADGGLFPAETVTRPRKTSEPACLFADSRFADYAAFAEQFKAAEFVNVDIVYYYHAVADWSAQKGKKMKDWIATARNFIRGDIEKGKLHKITTGPVLSPDAIQYLKDMAE